MTQVHRQLVRVTRPLLPDLVQLTAEVRKTLAHFLCGRTSHHGDAFRHRIVFLVVGRRDLREGRRRPVNFLGHAEGALVPIDRRHVVRIHRILADCFRIPIQVLDLRVTLLEFLPGGTKVVSYLPLFRRLRIAKIVSAEVFWLVLKHLVDDADVAGGQLVAELGLLLVQVLGLGLLVLE